MNKLKKRVRVFLIAGLSAVGMDFVTYYIMLNFSYNDIAKTLSFTLGTIVVFVVNKYYILLFAKYKKLDEDNYFFTYKKK